MAVGEGKFKLYSKITPPLEAGDWRLKVTQSLSAVTPNKVLDANDLKIDEENINVRIRSPRYLLPPDQILSTYPLTNSFGRQNHFESHLAIATMSLYYRGRKLCPFQPLVHILYKYMGYSYQLHLSRFPLSRVLMEHFVTTTPASPVRMLSFI